MKKPKKIDAIISEAKSSAKDEAVRKWFALLARAKKPERKRGLRIKACT